LAGAGLTNSSAFVDPEVLLVRRRLLHDLDRQLRASKHRWLGIGEQEVRPARRVKTCFRCRVRISPTTLWLASARRSTTPA
jgi:hypothetical protein